MPEDTTRWAASFLRPLLDQWRAASATDNGIFHPNLDRQWRQTAGAAPTLVSQCRLIYNFSRGAQLFGEARYAEATAHGLQALTRYFSLPTGGFRWSVASDGTPVDAAPDAYGHAFAILALATAAQALDDLTLAAQAHATWHYAAETFADAGGGLIWRTGGADGRSTERSQNPLMHMFEALMALCAVDDSGEARAAAGRLLAFVQQLAGFSEGRLIESYAADWTPLPPERGGVINIGHQFEWAFLLSDWHALTGEDRGVSIGRNFLETGLGWGTDADGGVWEACDPAGRVVAPGKELWPQCEALRALHRYARRHRQSPAEVPMRRTLDFYRRHFVDTEYGGLFAAIHEDGRPARADKGDIWKLDYHSLSMLMELIASATSARHSPEEGSL